MDHPLLLDQLTLTHVEVHTHVQLHQRTHLLHVEKDAHHTHLQVATVVEALHTLVRLSAEVSVVELTLVVVLHSHTDRHQDEADLEVEAVEEDVVEAEDEECQHSTLHNSSTKTLLKL